VTVLFNDTNLGAGKSFSRALDAAKGEWIAVVDSDDYIDRTRTAKSLEYARTHPELGVVGTWVHEKYESENRIDEETIAQSWFNRAIDLNDPANWAARNHLCNSSTMVRRSIYQNHGKPDDSLQRTADYEFWTRLLKHGERFGVIHQELTTRRVHSGGVTHGDPDRAFLETSFILCKNVIPLLRERRSIDVWFSVLDWWVNDTRIESLSWARRYFILFNLLNPQDLSNFNSFLNASTSRFQLLRSMANFSSNTSIVRLFRERELFDSLPKARSFFYWLARALTLRLLR
jgi:GT2 family glycosyltransferase